MLGKNFPVADYYKDNIIDAETISRSGSWWTAVLVIRDPRSGDPFISIYRWQKRKGEWKKTSSIKLSTQKVAISLQDALRNLIHHLDKSD